MAGSLHQQFSETIFAMKKRIIRPRDSSDSEDSDQPFRGQKQSLKRKVQYARSGNPDSLPSPNLQRKRIAHAGYQRVILQRNPARFDPDGDIVEAGDEYENEEDLSEVDESPYTHIHLETILAPLRSPADLPNHPSYSLAYTSKHLTNMANEATEVARRERITLGHARTLFNKLQGDSSFAPHALAALDQAPLKRIRNGSIRGPEPGNTNESLVGIEIQEGLLDHQSPVDTAMQDTDGIKDTNGHNDESDRPPMQDVNHGETLTNGVSQEVTADPLQPNGEQAPTPPDDDNASETAHRMTTRARAQAASTPSPPSSPSSTVNQIHPLFLVGTDSIPDRDFGLPLNEAEETRILLMAYVQKQDEIARAATDLCHGLLQGERMRQDVFKWSKAEAHVGEMSDGEDWYDGEEWGLDHALLKGRDEEEDDATVAGKKSTRQRRKPDKEDR